MYDDQDAKVALNDQDYVRMRTFHSERERCSIRTTGDRVSSDSDYQDSEPILSKVQDRNDRPSRPTKICRAHRGAQGTTYTHNVVDVCTHDKSTSTRRNDTQVKINPKDDSHRPATAL
ncbi:unnamed protein product [Phytophthora lilii]|uniref:Unnamed protein product n=1 Tax=Phytophthora lilii TaxID=2077276 RepID=A0A9W7CIT9_9STRA|nr:unnamed protein product [Phytophthora lilii]